MLRDDAAVCELGNPRRVARQRLLESWRGAQGSERVSSVFRCVHVPAAGQFKPHLKYFNEIGFIIH